MSVQLRDIADIRLGYHARGRIDPEPFGSHRIIQARDFDQMNRLDVDGIYRFTPETDPARYLISEGDVLLLSRGRDPVAVPVTMPLENTVCASYIFIIRLRSQQFDPRFLAWYLNQKPVQRELLAMSQGSRLQWVPRQALELVKVPVPPGEVQQSIINLDHLVAEERRLMRDLVDVRARLAESVSLEALMPYLRVTEEG